MGRKVAGLRLWAWGLIGLAGAVGLYVYTQRRKADGGLAAEQSGIRPPTEGEGIGGASAGSMAERQVGPSEPLTFPASQSAAVQPELAPIIFEFAQQEPAPSPAAPEPAQQAPIVVSQHAQPNSPAPPPGREISAAQVEAAGHPLVLYQASQEQRPGEAPRVISQVAQPVSPAPPPPPPPPSYPAAEAVVANYFPGGPAEHARWVKEHSGYVHH